MKDLKKSVHSSDKNKQEIVHHAHLDEPRTLFEKVKRYLIGDPKDIHDNSLFHKLALVPFLAWVGLGADGLSSSAYGPEEAFRALGAHPSLAILIALAMAITISIISIAYRKIIEKFPTGGGGYLVASKLLGPKVGLISGCALVVDYILTITVSIAAAGDALFSFIPPQWHTYKLAVEAILIVGLTILNLRGVRESIIILVPIFLAFLITHTIVILIGLFGSQHGFHNMVNIQQNIQNDWHALGFVPFLALLMHAYSLGGGTYTGIEAVSNGLSIMREPRVQTGKRTMTYMALSLAITATGLLVSYLFWEVVPIQGKTLNAVLVEKLVGSYSLGGIGFSLLTLVSEALLLVVAAQAGFLDGPRVLANMAIDHWVPRKFASLSERLVVSNGIWVMGLCSLGALFFTRGIVSALVVMYSINVFITFSLSILGMLKHSIQEKSKDVIVFTLGFILCSLILVLTTIEKFNQGGWVTIAITGVFVIQCLYIKRHYSIVAEMFQKKKEEHHIELENLQLPDIPFDDQLPSAGVLVAGFGSLGIETVKNILKTFPGVYKNLIFISVGPIDSGKFKGEDSLDLLREETKKMLESYTLLARSLGLGSTYRMALGTDVVEEGALLCQLVAQEFKHVTYFTGKLVFQQDKWIHRVLHNETGQSLQKRLLDHGLTMVIMPARVG